MAWTLDAKNTGVTENDLDGSLTFSHTTGSLTNGILFVWAAWSTTATTISSVTYNGVSMTLAVGQNSLRGVALYYLINPPAGTFNVVITGSGTFGRICAGSHSWSGANSTQTPTTAFDATTSLTPTINVSTNSGELIVDVIGVAFTAGETLTAGANQTEQGMISGGATKGASSTQNGADGGEMSWTNSAARAFGMVAASFDPAPSGGGTPLPVLVHSHKQQGIM